MKYAFILGTNHSLCKVEIINVLNSNDIHFEIIESSQEGLIIETKEALILDIDIFGSTAKIVQIIDTFPIEEFFKNFSRDIIKRDIFESLVTNFETKHIIYGISVYGFGGRFKDLNYGWFIAPTICRTLKEEISSYRIKSSYIPLKDRVLSSASVDNNKLLTEGFELVVGIGRHEVYVGKTLSVQDYKSYSFRDYKRPARDAKSGMVPPKLAKMMINLCNKSKLSTMVDPFCGSGTFLQEAALLGYTKIYGSDLEPKAINDSKTNINWLLKSYDLETENLKIKIDQVDVRDISRQHRRETVDMIVTEPYLGSSKAPHFNHNQILREVSSLENLYCLAFIEFQKILKADGVVCIILPVFRYNGQFFHLDIINKLRQIGFEPQKYMPTKYQSASNMAKLNLELTPKRNSITYYRPDQTVSREILLFKRQASEK